MENSTRLPLKRRDDGQNERRLGSDLAASFFECEVYFLVNSFQWRVVDRALVWVRCDFPGRAVRLECAWMLGNWPVFVLVS